MKLFVLMTCLAVSATLANAKSITLSKAQAFAIATSDSALQTRTFVMTEKMSERTYTYTTTAKAKNPEQWIYYGLTEEAFKAAFKEAIVKANKKIPKEFKNEPAQKTEGKGLVFFETNTENSETTIALSVTGKNVSDRALHLVASMTYVEFNNIIKEKRKKLKIK